jgi:phage tail sheath protein FI
MAFQVSPGVLVQEKDLTTIIPNVSTSIGGIVIAANKGPADDIVEVSSEKQLVDYFGKPSDFNASSWYTAANFLKYSGALKVVRAIDETAALNASGTAGVLIKNDDIWENSTPTAVGEFAAKTPGVWGNSLKVDVCPSAGAFDGTAITPAIPAIPAILGQIQSVAVSVGGSGFDNSLNGTHSLVDGVITHPASGVEAMVDVTVVSNIVTNVDVTAGGFGYDVGTTIKLISKPADFSATASYVVGEYVMYSNIAYEFTADHNATAWIGTDAVDVACIDIPDALTGTPGSGFVGTMVVEDVPEVPEVPAVPQVDAWVHAHLFDAAPGTTDYAANLGGANDEIYIVVSDEDGDITGVADTVLETFICSKASDVRSVTGEGMFYKDVLFRSSQYIYWMEFPTVVPAFGGAINGETYNTDHVAYSLSLKDGANGVYPTSGDFKEGLDLFNDADTVDVNLIMAGPGDQVHSQNIINLCNDRKDCLGFISPEMDDVVGVASTDTQTQNVKGYFDVLSSTSYVVFDSGWKYQYDTYNDVYRWVPLNGDLAGTCANTDDVADPWFSPAGMSRGNIKSVVKLAYNPKKNERDTLYKARINPVVTFPGMGTLLWGDKTAQAKASAFDRINVRRLFMVLEKAISIASKAQLFELNDDITRSNFVAMTEPFLRDVQGRRGITDFKVVCDTSNNTGDVIDRNEFRADIYIKPARSINFITLTFVATRTGVSFSEVGA